MNRQAVRLAAVVTIAAIAAGAWALREHLAPPAPLAFQGYVEGELLFVGPEEGGRIEHLAVRAGQDVAAGAPLFALDAVVQTAQRDEARARLDQARAIVANLRAAQNRPEQIAVLQAAEERARVALDYAQREYTRQRELLDQGVTPRARFETVAAELERDRAALEEVRRQITAARLAGRSADIAAAESGVDATEAALRQGEARLGKRSVAAPAAGIVQDIYFRTGEAINASQPVLALLPPGNRKLRFYVPEVHFAAMPIGAVVVVHCDGCGTQGLPARITFASREAEFTPPVIFSREERARLVFRLEARFEGAAPPLPLGLPVQIRPREPP